METFARRLGAVPTSLTAGASAGCILMIIQNSVLPAVLLGAMVGLFCYIFVMKVTRGE